MIRKLFVAYIGLVFYPQGKAVPSEAIGFLSAVGVFIVLLAVLFLFINKKLCFETIGGLPYLEPRGKRKHSKDKTGIREGLGYIFFEVQKICTHLDLVSSLSYWHFVKIWSRSSSKNLEFNKGELNTSSTLYLAASFRFESCGMYCLSGVSQAVES